MKHVAFLGDGEHTFDLTFQMIKELETQTGVGIGGLFHRVRSFSFHATDLSETIRLALIGGGMTPADAFKLVQTYVEPRPLSETLPIVLSILETVWFGSTGETDEDSDTKETPNGK
ncbi:MAG: hypothetical protein MnENMB40S_22610 [Rhizobiaceae bacterium MnEN-MB40S]|nr:MAG: hypothetical protein MnENMB40S_22610 [Rhizobiaceae bacterium MnEN-MB40S]